jgi:hypothetical protein
VTLTGWQAVAILAIGAGLGLAAVFVPSEARALGLMALAGSIIGGVLGMFTARSPQSRTRAADRRDTAAGGVQITPPPELHPPRR